MVYLIRNTRVVRDWEKMEAAARALTAFWAKQPQVKSVEVWSNIAGRQDEYQFVVKFDSLADEEKFALKLWDDKGYEAVMIQFMGVFELQDDELKRSID
ncbi:MAG: hypothetical protein ABSF43_06455 [Rectinemataceae bacterium]